MEPDSIINLFDSLWFYNKKEPIPNPVTHQKTHKRSNSDHFPNSPNSVLSTPHLETIKSGKPNLSIQIPPRNPHFNQKPNKDLANKKRLSKSMSELESEELSGFLDLGFVFSEEDKDSDLADILPGLHRLGRENNGPNVGPREIHKPYLSEAWEVLRKKEKEESNLMKWKLPNIGNENDMKDSLKWWAHTVASAAAAR